MKNINHTTFNTGHNLKYKDDTVILEESWGFIKKMVDIAKEGKCIELCDKTLLVCTMNANKKIYVATLFGIDKGLIPVLTTTGAVEEKGAKIAWDLSKIIHKFCDTGIHIACPEPPFICDFIFPQAIFRSDVLTWSGYLTKCFGVGMLGDLSGEKLCRGCGL